MHIYLLRHGRTTAAGSYSGINDVDLTEEGEKQVRDVAPFLSSLPFDGLYCSPLLRCRKTAVLLDIKKKICYERDLREINFGRWEGLTYDQIAEFDRDNLELWSSQKDSFTFPGGDNIREFNNTIGSWFDNLLKKDIDTVLIITHAGVIRQAICHLLCIDQGGSFCFETQEGAVTLISHQNGFSRLMFLNRRKE